VNGQHVHAAHAYAARGWPVFRCRPAGKEPLESRGFHDATSDPEVIRERWARRPDANIGVPTGQPSGMVALDVDGDEGADSLHELEGEHGELPATRSVKTPHGGAHYCFAWPGHEVPSTQKLAGYPGLDFRGDGGYVVAPPSRMAAGAYVIDCTAPPAPMPAWLVALTATDPGGAEPIDWDAYAVRLIDGFTRGRNPALAQLAGLLLRRHVPYDLAAVLVHAANRTYCKPPKPDGEVAYIVNSIAGREGRRRGYWS
jgi:hypothetical protein